MLIKEVKSKEDLESFISFQYELYSDDANFRPELRSELRNFFTKNPFLKKAKIEFYLAFENNKPVGRIVKIDPLNKINKDSPILFGFFECNNNYEIAKALFDKIREKNRLILGPINFTTNDSCGLLIEGYDYPSFMMPYNKKYYKEFFERYGLNKKIDLFAYYVKRDTVPEDLITKARILEVKLKDIGIKIRNINFKNFDKEVFNLRKVYNESNKNNWGFMPLSLEEFQYMAKGLRKIASSKYVLLAEKNGEFIGFLISVPDINEIIFTNGKLNLKSIIKLLFFKPTKIKILIIGVKEEYRTLGIATCMINKVVELAKKDNIKAAEASYILENNKEMNLILKKINGQIYKKYRIYEG